MKKHFRIILVILILFLFVLGGCEKGYYDHIPGTDPVKYCKSLEWLQKLLDNENDKIMIVPDLSEYPVDEVAGKKSFPIFEASYGYANYKYGIGINLESVKNTALASLTVECQKNQVEREARGHDNSGFNSHDYSDQYNAEYFGVKMCEWENDSLSDKYLMKIITDNAYPQETYVYSLRYLFDYVGCLYVIRGDTIVLPKMWMEQDKNDVIEKRKQQCKEELLEIIQSIITRAGELQ